MPADEDRPYHHGDLRRALMEVALDHIERDGPAHLSLRALAREVGVTHGAATHHFGDKTGLLTALAAEGYGLLAEHLERAAEDGDFADVGVAYVRFASAHPAHFDVMFRPDLLRGDDPVLAEARSRTGGLLYRAASGVADATGGDEVRAAVAGWSYVHGLATLWRGGNLPPAVGDDVVTLARQIVPYLFQASTAAAARRPE